MKLPDTFQGYHPPTSNTTYTPNQFFDVVLPRSSRGVVRLVAYMIRKSLGWCDAHGNPQEPQVVVSYRELIEDAGIGRARIKEAIEEAIACRYIVCLREARPNTAGSLGVSALYELRWDERESYVTDPDRFDGFYAGNGNLTYIPNEFFDYTIPSEPLAVVRVVGAIIRHTIGFQTRYGMRRQQIAMSYGELQRRTRLTPRSVSLALQQALEGNHIVRIQEGFFDTNAGLQSKAAVYGIRWIDRQMLDISGPVKVIDETDTTSNDEETSRTVPKVYRETNGSKSIADGNSERFQKYSGDGSKSVAGKRFQKYSDIEIKDINNTFEIQQQSAAVEEAASTAAVVALSDETKEAVSLLLSAGFDRKTANHLAMSYPSDRIKRQVSWISLRSAAKNRLGMLRRSIEEDWPKPESNMEPSRSGEQSYEHTFVSHFYAAWGGNAGDPIATPSQNDIQAARAYAAKLSRLTPEQETVQQLGKAFGDFVREAEQKNPRALRSFVVALRSYGDEFYVRRVEETKKARKQLLTARKKAHEEKFNGIYIAYLRDRETEIQSHYPELYETFTLDTEQKRRRYEEGPFKLSGTLKERLTAIFDNPDQHADRFREFFNSHGVQICDFWEWDATSNPDRFNPEDSLQ